jgi:nucleoside-diphosphate-sugar epimerase
MSRCAVTGATGYLGGRVVRFFRSHAWQVVPLGRNLPNGGEGVSYQLDTEVPLKALAGIDTLIHCAYDFQARTTSARQAINVQGSVRLLKAACEMGIEKVIFVSSMAAYEGCKSQYGATKRAIEREVSDSRTIVVRPGMIYGKDAGGLFAALRRAISALPVVPLIGNGRYPLFTAHEDDLCELLFDLATDRAQSREHQPIVAAATETVEFRQLLRDLALTADRHPLLLPLPWRLPFYSLRLLEATGLQIGLRSDSVLSVVEANRNPEAGTDTTMRNRFRPFLVDDL